MFELLSSIALGGGLMLLFASRRRSARLPTSMKRLVIDEPNMDLALARVRLEDAAPLPKLRRGEVCIKVCAAAINPSDYGAWRSRSKGAYPKALGQECSGTVVATGGGLVTLGLLGARVAAMPGRGTYAEYVKCSAWKVVTLPSSFPLADGCELFINPLTVVAMLLTAKARRAKAIIHTGASSALGQMLVKAAPLFGITVVNVTHKQQHVEMLRSLGATHVLDSSAATYAADLEAKIRELSIKVAFDCVAGESTGQLVAALPPGGTVFAYGRLSSSYLSAIPVIDLIYRGKKVEGFLVTSAFAKLGWRGVIHALRALRFVKHRLDSTFATAFVDVALGDVYAEVLAIDPQKPGARSVTNKKMRVRFE